MPLTRDFRETVAARVQRDPRFREALFTEALNSYLAGDAAEGKAILRDLVNATIGFEGLAAEVRMPSKSPTGCSVPAATQAPKTSSRSSMPCRRRPASSCA